MEMILVLVILKVWWKITYYSHFCIKFRFFY